MCVYVPNHTQVNNYMLYRMFIQIPITLSALTSMYTTILPHVLFIFFFRSINNIKLKTPTTRSKLFYIPICNLLIFEYSTFLNFVKAITLF